MNDKEFIKELEKFDQDDVVYAWNCGCGGCGMYDYEVEKVEDKMDRFGTKILLSGD